MITVLLFDFSRVILNPIDPTYAGSLNELHDKYANDPEYNFFNYYQINHELLEFLRPLKRKYTLAIFTTGTIQEVSEMHQYIHPLFGHVFTVHDTGIPKKEPKAYWHIANQLEKTTSEIFFTDDQIENIEAAKKSGCTALQYRTNAQLFATIIQLDR